MTGRAAGIVIGVGNPFRQDDGVGPEVARRVAEGLGCEPLRGHQDARVSDAVPGATPSDGDRSPTPSEIEVVELDGEPTRLIEAWTDRRFAVVIDAVAEGGTPGSFQVECLGVGDPRLPERGGGTHAMGIGEAVALGEALDRMPEHLVVVGVRGTSFGEGDTMTAPVLAAVGPVTAVVERIARQLANGRNG